MTGSAGGAGALVGPAVGTPGSAGGGGALAGPALGTPGAACLAGPALGTPGSADGGGALAGPALGRQALPGGRSARGPGAWGVAAGSARAVRPRGTPVPVAAAEPAAAFPAQWAAPFRGKRRQNRLGSRRRAALRQRSLHLLQSGHRRLHEVDGVAAAQRLGHHVLDPSRLHDGANRASGLDAGAWLPGLDDDARGPEVGDDRVRHRAAGQRHRNQTAACDSVALADGVRNGAALAESRAQPALPIANDDHGVEGEMTSPLHDLGHAADMDNVLLEVGRLLRIPVVSVGLRQNSRPSSRAPSASALTRPW